MRRDHRREGQRDRSRPELAHLLGRLRRGDTLVVVRIDRLARSLSHLLAILDRLQAAGMHFRSLSDPIDTANPTGRLVVQVIGAMAEFERNLIAERTKAGLAVAKARGRKLGNPGLQAGDSEARCRLAAGQKRAHLAAFLSGLDAWLPTVRRLRPATCWDEVTGAVNRALPTAARRFTRDRLVRSVQRLVTEGLAEPALLAPAAHRQPKSRPAFDAAVRYLRNHRREASERGIAAANYRPPTLAQVARHLKEDARLSPPGGGTWVPSSVKALIDRAVRTGLIEPKNVSNAAVPHTVRRASGSV